MVMLLVTLTGIFVVSALIGVLSSGLDAKLEELRKRLRESTWELQRETKLAEKRALALAAGEMDEAEIKKAAENELDDEDEQASERRVIQCDNVSPRGRRGALLPGRAGRGEALRGRRLHREVGEERRGTHQRARGRGRMPRVVLEWLVRS